MKLHELQPAPYSTKRRKRVGRGISAGKGKTAGRGAKGQNKRSGGGKGPYFEGGQLPLVRRLPMLRGFTNRNRVEYQPVNIYSLVERFEAGAEITPVELAAAGLIRGAKYPVAILGDGEIKTAVHVKAHRVSASARAKIEAAGGTVEILPL
ncbi:MAG: 50S ribosomal protein L15 [Chloroflexi bacterium]|nr:50S ribosomal protein L15 [Chloroflexota bacterium]